MPEKDYYKILDVDKKATTDEIKRAFKKSAMQYHPDRPGGDEKKFKEINEAYQILSDTTKRQQYDQFGSNFEQQGGGFNGGMNWEDFMNATRGGGNSQGFAGFDFGDLFGFGGGGRNNQQDNRGRDIQVDVDVEFKEAAFGIEKTLKIRKQTKCSVCHGEGTEPGSKLETCHTCKGQGQVRHQQQTFLGSMSMVSTCPDCQGRGKKADKACKHCGGDGVVSEANEMNIKIPAGINNGESIRLTGQGEAAPHNGGSGDLYVRVRVLPLHGFHRDGFDIYTEVEINFTQAVLGDKVEIETLDGSAKLMIPEGTQSEQLIRLKGKGITHLGRTSRGDQYVKVKVMVPKKVNKKLKKMLEEMREML